MGTEIEIPRFAELLGPTLAQLGESALPGFLAGLERSAAQRYRSWAEACGDPEDAQVLLACAAREDEIAERVQKLFPVGESDERQIEALLPEARRTYLSVFEPHATRDQYRIQANAERQGAEAWRSIAQSHPDTETREVLLGCAELEEQSASALETLLS